ncbi:hypothetical protein HK100_000292, partial [Physocladia obscura]
MQENNGYNLNLNGDSASDYMSSSLQMDDWTNTQLQKIIDTENTARQFSKLAPTSASLSQNAALTDIAAASSTPAGICNSTSAIFLPAQQPLRPASVSDFLTLDAPPKSHYTNSTLPFGSTGPPTPIIRNRYSKKPLILPKASLRQRQTVHAFAPIETVLNSTLKINSTTPFRIEDTIAFKMGWDKTPPMSGKIIDHSSGFKRSYNRTFALEKSAITSKLFERENLSKFNDVSNYKRSRKPVNNNNTPEAEKVNGSYFNTDSFSKETFLSSDDMDNEKEYSQVYKNGILNVIANDNSNLFDNDQTACVYFESIENLGQLDNPFIEKSTNSRASLIRAYLNDDDGMSLSSGDFITQAEQNEIDKKHSESQDSIRQQACAVGFKTASNKTLKISKSGLEFGKNLLNSIQSAKSNPKMNADIFTEKVRPYKFAKSLADFAAISQLSTNCDNFSNGILNEESLFVDKSLNREITAVSWSPVRNNSDFKANIEVCNTGVISENFHAIFSDDNFTNSAVFNSENSREFMNANASGLPETGQKFQTILPNLNRDIERHDEIENAAIDTQHRNFIETKIPKFARFSTGAGNLAKPLKKPQNSKNTLFNKLDQEIKFSGDQMLFENEDFLASELNEFSQKKEVFSTASGHKLADQKIAAETMLFDTYKKTNDCESAVPTKYFENFESDFKPSVFGRESEAGLKLTGFSSGTGRKLPEVTEQQRSFANALLNESNKEIPPVQVQFDKNNFFSSKTTLSVARFTTGTGRPHAKSAHDQRQLAILFGAEDKTSDCESAVPNESFENLECTFKKIQAPNISEYVVEETPKLAGFSSGMGKKLPQVTEQQQNFANALLNESNQGILLAPVQFDENDIFFSKSTPVKVGFSTGTGRLLAKPTEDQKKRAKLIFQNLAESLDTPVSAELNIDESEISQIDSEQPLTLNGFLNDIGNKLTPVTLDQKKRAEFLIQSFESPISTPVTRKNIAPGTPTLKKFRTPFKTPLVNSVATSSTTDASIGKSFKNLHIVTLIGSSNTFSAANTPNPKTPTVGSFKQKRFKVPTSANKFVTPSRGGSVITATKPKIKVELKIFFETA